MRGHGEWIGFLEFQDRAPLLDHGARNCLLRELTTSCARLDLVARPAVMVDPERMNLIIED